MLVPIVVAQECADAVTRAICEVDRISWQKRRVRNRTALSRLVSGCISRQCFRRVTLKSTSQSCRFRRRQLLFNRCYPPEPGPQRQPSPSGSMITRMVLTSESDELLNRRSGLLARSTRPERAISHIAIARRTAAKHVRRTNSPYGPLQGRSSSRLKTSRSSRPPRGWKEFRPARHQRPTAPLQATS